MSFPERLEERVRGPQYFRCGGCQIEVFDTIEALKCHLVRCHQPANVLQCVYCAHRIISLRIAKQHRCVNDEHWDKKRAFFSFRFYDVGVSTNNVVYTFVERSKKT